MSVLMAVKYVYPRARGVVFINSHVPRAYPYNGLVLTKRTCVLGICFRDISIHFFQ